MLWSYHGSCDWVQSVSCRSHYVNEPGSQAPGYHGSCPSLHHQWASHPYRQRPLLGVCQKRRLWSLMSIQRMSRGHVWLVQSQGSCWGSEAAITWLSRQGLIACTHQRNNPYWQCGLACRSCFGELSPSSGSFRSFVLPHARSGENGRRHRVQCRRWRLGGSVGQKLGSTCA